MKEKIKQKAFNWSVDYKPFDEGLTPQEYAKYGYEKGYKQAIRDLETKKYIEGYDSGYKQATHDCRGLLFIEKNPVTSILLSVFIAVIIFVVVLISQ